MTIQEALFQAQLRFKAAGIETPRLDGELLLEHVTGIPRLRLQLEPEMELSSDQLRQWERLMIQREQRIPLQHLMGTASFCGLSLTVNKAVLIPRPETELLAEAAWKFLEDRAGATQALDWGTGSGCIAIALAVHCPGVQVTALDLSPEALNVAARNASHHRVESRIGFCLGDGFQALQQEGPFDLIVSNPPYIAREEIEELQPEVRDHDPRMALDGGGDGLQFYRELAKEASRHLQLGGRLMMEFGDGQEGSLATLLERSGWKLLSIEQDYAGKPRFLIAQARDW